MGIMLWECIDYIKKVMERISLYEDPRHGSRPELENPRVPLKEKSTAPVQESTAHAFSGTPENIEIYINKK